MKKIRLIALLLVAFVVFTACSGCSKGSDTSSTASGGTSSVVTMTKGEYHVVVPEGSEYKTTIALDVYNVMNTWENVEVYCTYDNETNNGPEIIIGDCNRPIVAEAVTALTNLGGGSNDDYIIYANNGSIVVTGFSDAAIKAAVAYFVANVLKPDAALSGVVYSYVKPAEAGSGVTINGVKLDNKYTLVVPQYNMSYLVRIQLEELQKAFTSKLGITLKEATDATAPTFTQEMINLYYGKTWSNCETATDYKNYVNSINSLDKTKTKTEYTYEIVIGDCDRAGRPAITDKNQYTIKVAGNKIFLNGGSPAATAMAVSEFAKMVNGGALTLTDASTVVGNYKTAISNYDRKNYYTLAWGDDFDGTSINTNKWVVSYGRDSTIYSDGLNGRIPARASKELNNNYVKDGKLYICATYDDKYYYGGHLTTKGIMTFQYGYVETSCLKPFGQGFWTSLWVDNQYLDKGLGRMEIDVNESYGAGHLTLQNSFAWINTTGIRTVLSKYNFRIPNGYAFNKSNIQYNADNRGFYLDYHTFGYGWDANELYFTIDGKVTSRYDYATAAMVFGNASSAASLGTTVENARKAELEVTKSAFSTPAFLRLSMAVGFAAREFVVPDGSKEWTESNKFIIDYVHVYQYSGQKLYKHN